MAEEQLTFAHHLGNLLVLSSRDFDIVDCHHDGEELVFFSCQRFISH